MNIIICGAGRVGFTIAKLLSGQGHSITIIGKVMLENSKILSRELQYCSQKIKTKYQI